MEEKKFIIRPQKYNGGTSVISMRIPGDMLEDVDKVAAETGRTRNEVLMLSIEYALKNLVIEDEKE
jgi:metal-responsive CopG/Arc/MetJ family transcriptional regulator